MNIVKAHNLACPIDGERLECREKQLVCENGHAFDIARQGYVNLLPVQHKRSKRPGDSKEMVSARAHFLNSGNYEPVANKLAEMVFAQITDDKETCLMDAGCGEGYYFDYVLNELKGKNAGNDLSFIGLDISKAAIAEAAKRNRQITWVVGTNRQPPVESASVDVVLCVFGFQSFEGFHKILKAGGRLILAEPGPDHLKELREIIYTEVRKTDPPDLSCLEETGLSLLDRQTLHIKAEVINNEQINNLLKMTPHFYRANKPGREAAAKVQELDVTVDVVFRTLEKK
jgi:23S rRNA (guanine745-N1)-methyltransferase